MTSLSSSGTGSSELAGRRDTRVYRVRMLIDGKWHDGNEVVERRDPYTGDIVSVAPVSSRHDVDSAVQAASRAKSSVARIPAYERATILRKLAELMREHGPAMALMMSREIGKALKDSLAEVDRSIDTLLLSAEEAVRIQGEHVPLDASSMGHGKLAFLLRFPVGVVAGITPFNAPLNLACHKLGPAIAAGNSVVLKASPQAPAIVYRLSELFVEAGGPPGMLNTLYGGSAGQWLVRHPNVDFVSFTGSSKVGADVKASSGLKRVALELGGNGATLVHEDADVAVAAATCARNSMRLAGQSCISVQNVHVHESIFAEFLKRTIDEVGLLRMGDPVDPRTDVGTLVDADAAIRVEEWVAEAVEAGATTMTGGVRHGAALEPTTITGVRPDLRLSCNEVFGPVLVLFSYSDVRSVFDTVNQGEYGLHFGLFTKTLDLAVRAIREVRVGGIIVNGTTTWRTDQMPYGGVKASGIGREGPHYALRDMCDERLVVFNL